MEKGVWAGGEKELKTILPAYVTSSQIGQLKIQQGRLHTKGHNSGKLNQSENIIGPKGGKDKMGGKGCGVAMRVGTNKRVRTKENWGGCRGGTLATEEYIRARQWAATINRHTRLGRRRTSVGRGSKQTHKGKGIGERKSGMN